MGRRQRMEKLRQETRIEYVESRLKMINNHGYRLVGYSNVNIDQKFRSLSQSVASGQNLLQRFPKKYVEEVDRFDALPGLLCAWGDRFAFGLPAPSWTRRGQDGDFPRLRATRLGNDPHLAGLGCYFPGGVSPHMEP